MTISKNDYKYPLVTIITPVFNGIQYLEECLNSVINQTYENIEQIVVDGGSKDGSIELVKEYVKRYPKIFKHIIGPDKGPGDAWKKGYCVSKGEILGWIGADDLLVPDGIEKIVKFFNENPEAYFLHTDCEYIDEKGNFLFKHIAEEIDFKEFVNTARHISFPASYYRREVIETQGGLNESGDDYLFLIEVIMQFKIYRINQVTSRFRVHAGGHSNTDNFEVYFETRKKIFMESRKYGGSLTSRIAKTYYLAQAIKWLHLENNFTKIYQEIQKISKLLKKV